MHPSASLDVHELAHGWKVWGLRMAGSSGVLSSALEPSRGRQKGLLGSC